MNLKSARLAIEKHGILLVYPLANKSLPLSLWSHFFPGKKMEWRWDESGDSGVADMWHLREKLASSRAVVYAKWYQGRATFFSREVFPALLNRIHGGNWESIVLSRDSEFLLGLLEEDSPQSMKALRKRLRKNRWSEKQTETALRELWGKLLIVGLGEIEDGAFPSLLVGSTRLIWDELWEKAQSESVKFQKIEKSVFSFRTPWGRYLQKVRSHELKKRGSVSPDDSPKVLSYSDLVSGK